MSGMLNALTPIAGIGYFCLGVLQLFATVDGIALALGVHGIFAWFIAIFVAYMPLIGTGAGIYGAIEAWGWDTWTALALFLGPYAVYLVLYIVARALEPRS